jgi:hypothetical protein
MNFFIKYLIFFGLFYACVTGGYSFQGIGGQDVAIDSQINLELNVKISKSSTGTYELVFGLTNRGQTPVKLNPSDLPWRWRPTLIMVLMTVPGGRVLEEVPILNCPQFDPKLLNPNSEIGGRLNLCYYYPNLPQVLKESDVILFWSYPRYFDINPSSLRRGGWILIEKETN